MQLYSNVSLLRRSFDLRHLLSVAAVLHPGGPAKRLLRCALRLAVLGAVGVDVLQYCTKCA